LKFDGLHDPRLIEALRAGAVGVIPTDTIYGLVCSAADQAAVARLYGLKNRIQKLGTLIGSSPEQFVALGLKARYLKAVEQYWPGPISIIIPCGPELQYLHLGKFGLALRIPAVPEIRKLLEQTGALLTTSANAPGQPPATTIEEARTYFGDRVDFYIDGGDLSANAPSTIIRVIDDAIEVVREGAVKIDEDGNITT
jgi:L-threonylcarbamoyladenylate synthase